MRRNKLCASVAILAALIAVFACPARPQVGTPTDRQRALEMWSYVATQVEMCYYDPQFHGVDWKRTIHETRSKIQSAPSLDVGMAYIEQALLTLNDSHTIFLPPWQHFLHDYGYRMEMIGDRCFVTRVRPGSDAEAKGVRPGDELMSVDDLHPVRNNFWTIDYRFNALRIDRAQEITLLDAQGKTRQLEVMTKFKQFRNPAEVSQEAKDLKPLWLPRWDEVGNGVGVVKLATFVLEAPEVDALIDKARKYPALIVDLRGNAGGSPEVLQRLLGGMFQQGVKIADVVGRKGSKPQVAKSRSRGVFTGKLVVLVDSRSASASELFARVIQLEKRGVVVGDHSAGAVMDGRVYSFRLNADRYDNVYYGVEITIADLIMSDGKSLEHTGVTPDELVLPTLADLAAGRDPALARAAALLGATLTPEDAGKKFPYEWPIDQ